MTDAGACEFGGFVLEKAQRRLRRGDGTTVELTPRLFGALLFFVEHPGELLSKDALLQGIWPGLVVDENNLNQVVAGLRRALGDEAQGSRFIQTVPRHGFRFVQDVTRSDLPPPPSIVAPALADLAAPGARTQAAPRRKALLWLGGAATLGVAGWLITRRAPAVRSIATRDSARTTGASVTLAVLPFKPLVGERRDELLELGMADSLISRLSAVRGLVVRSTGSVQRFAGPGQDPMRAAHELDVTWIVDGTLVRSENLLRTTARLLNADTGVAAWTGSFDARFTSVFEVQDQISRRVAQALMPVLDAGLKRTATLSEIGGTLNTEAYQLYLAAKWRAQGGRAAEVEKGIALLNQALSLDPAYAMAWVELAQIYRRKLWNSDGLASEVFEPGNAALRRALHLVPDFAAAHAGVGFGHYWYTFDWHAAKAEFERALATNPNTATAHWGLGGLLLNRGHLRDGFDHLTMARSLDPMSPVINTVESSYLLEAGRREDARMRLSRALDIAPNLWLTHQGLGLLELAEDRPAQGIASLRRAVELSDASRPRAVLGFELARLGQLDEARDILRQLLADARSRYILPTSIASLHAGLGESQSAMAALERALELRDVRMAYVKDDPHWLRLRSEPRFIAILKALKVDGLAPGLVPL